MTFLEAYQGGLVAESGIARWLIRRGCAIMPVYEKAEGEYKGPQLYTADQSYVAPDMMVIKNRAAMFVEAKHKSIFSYYRIEGRFQTGIDLPHYKDYLRVAGETGLPLYLFFLHKPSQATKKTSGRIPPSGLYWAEIRDLELTNPRVRKKDAHSPRGMVYWNEKDLKKIAEYSEVVP